MRAHFQGDLSGRAGGPDLAREYRRDNSIVIRISCATTQSNSHCWNKVLAIYQGVKKLESKVNGSRRISIWALWRAGIEPRTLWWQAYSAAWKEQVATFTSGNLSIGLSWMFPFAPRCGAAGSLESLISGQLLLTKCLTRRWHRCKRGRREQPSLQPPDAHEIYGSRFESGRGAHSEEADGAGGKSGGFAGLEGAAKRPPFAWRRRLDGRGSCSSMNTDTNAFLRW